MNHVRFRAAVPPTARRGWRIALTAALLAAATAVAQPYPARPVRLVVPLAAGGATDVTARAVAQRLSELLGQPMVVENRPGAHAVIGAELVARSPPDGYTLLYTTSSVIAINPFLYAKLPYDPVRDFMPVALCCTMDQSFIVNASLGTNSLGDLVALARSRPGAFSYGSMGTGSTGHLYMEAFKKATGMDVVHVPYKGSAPAIADMMGGRIAMMVVTLSVVQGQVRSGKLRGLAVGSGTRSALFPDVPTNAEAGYPAFQATEWLGIFAPAGTPAEIVARLHAQVARLLGSEEFREQWLRKNGFAPPASNAPEYFANLIQSDLQRFRELVKLTGARAD